VKALLIAVLPLIGNTAAGPDPTFPKPAIERVRIVGDTVWFEGTRGFDTVGTRYCFVRRTAGWCHLPRKRVAFSSIPRIPRTPAESLVVAPGVTLLCRPVEADPSSCHNAYGVLSADDGRVGWLTPQASPATRDALQRAIKLETAEPPEMSTSITAHATDDRSIWFGLGGAISEGDGAFGGLLRFDRVRRTVETITHPKLASASVTGLAIDGDALWIGTMHPEEHGPYGSTGVLRRDLRTGRWTQLDSATTELPDNLVHALAAAAGALYVATVDGLAAFDAKSGRWNVRYFRRTIIADSVVYELATARPADEYHDETTYLVMEELHVKRRGEFVAAMHQARSDYLATNHDSLVGSFVDVLTHPVLIPFLVEALEVPDARSLAVAALAEIRDPRTLPPLRDLFSRAPERVSIAAAMAQIGDSASLAWLHAELRSSTSSRGRAYIIGALDRLRDTTSVEPIFAALGRERDDQTREYIARSLARYRSVAIWRRMVDTAGRMREMRRMLVDLADSVALNDSTTAAALGEWSLALIGSEPPSRSADPALAIAARLRPHEAVRTIMRVFAADERWAESAVPQLIMLTGVDSGPAVRPWRERGRRLAWEFWTAWWRTNASSYRVVSRDEGARAQRRWLDRVIARERLQYQRAGSRRS
jgi:hypothetical protein